MKKIKCYSVRLNSLYSISDKAVKAIAFDGSEAILPKSQVFDQDYDVQKSDAYWISAWILEQKDLQYSAKKEGWYNPNTGRVEPKYHVQIEKHEPELIEAVNIDADANLIRQSTKSI